MFRRILLVAFLLMPIFFNIPVNADSKPVLVLASVAFQNKMYHGINYRSGEIYPEIAINQDGTWREAGIEDLWVEQEFITYARNDFAKSVGRVKVKSLKDFSGLLYETMEDHKYSVCFWGIYAGKKYFRQQGTGERIEGKVLDKEILKEFSPDKYIKHLLKNVLESDWENIQKDFTVEFSSKLWSYLTGDLNGDRKKDYIIALGEYYNGLEGKAPGAVVVAYISQGAKYKRFPVHAWNEATDQSGFPMLLFTCDFNGDGAEELVIADADSDTIRPMVYGWEGGKLIVLYFGRQFWQL